MLGGTMCGGHSRKARQGLPFKSSAAGRLRKGRGGEGNTAALARCVKTATLAVAILVAFCVEGSAQEVLSGSDIRSRIVGHSFHGKKGIMSVSLLYAEDGTVSMKAPMGTGTGTWALSDNQLCVKMLTGPRKMDDCLTFTRQPDGTYRASNGMRLTPTE